MSCFYRKIFLASLLLHSAVYPMLVPRHVRAVGSNIRGTSALGQQRSYFSPIALQKVKKTIAGHPELEKFDLAQGLALKQSDALSNAFNATENSSDWVKITKQMFHRVTPAGDLLPTKNLHKVATFITPEIMGTLMGAIETGELKRGASEFTQDIIDAWYGNESVQAKLADVDGLEYSAKFRKDVGSFFNFVTQLSQKNKDVLNSILLAFLYQKINHFNEEEEFHDWMHFLASINEYIPVFSAQELEKTHRKLLAPNDYKSWLDSKLFTFKLNVVPYSPLQYANFLVKNLPLIVSDIIESNKTESIYPPKVIMDEYGYKGQKKKGDCVETAIRDILYNLFYDPKTKSFSVAKYPLLPIDSRLKAYIEMTTTENINTLAMGQLFMDLVSGRDPKTNISYVERDYELRSSPENILHVLNTLLGIHAQDWSSLGKELTIMSENKIKIDCSLNSIGVKDEVTITISDTMDNSKKYIDLCIMKIHAYVTFPDREKIKYNRINLKTLATLPSINPLLRSLFYLVRDINIDVSESHAQEMSPLLYFSWSVKNDDEKFEVIQKLLLNHSQDKDAIQYAYSLFKSMNTPTIQLLKDIHLFKEYCHDKDTDFKKRTKQAVISHIGLLHLKTLLQEMTIEKVQQLLSSFMSIKDFDKILLSNSNAFEAILSDKDGDKLLLYVLKKKLLREDESGYYRELITEKLMSDLSDNNFIKRFYALHPRWLSGLLDILSIEVLDVLSIDTEDIYYKESICSLLLEQNIDNNNEQLYKSFYSGLFPLYISLLEKNYFKYIQELGDIRLRLKKGSDLYHSYDARMNALQQKATILRE